MACGSSNTKLYQQIHSFPLLHEICKRKEVNFTHEKKHKTGVWEDLNTWPLPRMLIGGDPDHDLDPDDTNPNLPFGRQWSGCEITGLHVNYYDVT